MAIEFNDSFLNPESFVAEPVGISSLEVSKSTELAIALEQRSETVSSLFSITVPGATDEATDSSNIISDSDIISDQEKTQQFFDFSLTAKLDEVSLLAAAPEKQPQTFQQILDRNGSLITKLGLELAALVRPELTLQEAINSPLVANSLLQFSSDNRAVVVDFFAQENPNTLVQSLQDLGVQITGQYENAISGLVPVGLLQQVADLENLQFARAAYQPLTNIGATTSQADTAVNAELVREQLGFDGTGVTVGVLSDSFNALGRANTDIASGDLPGTGNPFGNTTPVVVLQEDLSRGNIDEGRAMLQLIHDLAPGANLAFNTAFLGIASFAQGIVNLANVAGADVIVDDIIYLNEPMFQDGIIAQAVDTVAQQGVAYYSSAGNNGADSYESTFENSGTAGIRGGVFHDFDSGTAVDTLQSITVPGGTSVTFSFQWSEPYASAGSGNPGSSSDLNLYIFDAAGRLVSGGFNNNIGADPSELVSVTNRGFRPLTVNLAIELVSGPAPELLKYVHFGSLQINEFATDSSTSFGHANAEGASSVGAAFYQDTPAFGTNPPQLEDFSSLGGVPIFFDAEGNALPEPQVRQNVDIVAPDGTNTTFFPSATADADGDGFPNFFGTSAAAPHAAAVAALLLDAAPGSSPASINSALEQTAIDMDNPFSAGFDTGYDLASGFGLIQADLALDALTTANIDVLNGGAQGDRLDGLAGNDTLRGRDGDDTLIGGLGADLIQGQADDDNLDGGEGIDTLQGGIGNDLLAGGTGNDSMLGGSDNDRLIGGDGDDQLMGMGGLDTFVLNFPGLGADFVADFVDGDDRIDLSLTTITNLGGLQITASGVNALIATSTGTVLATLANVNPSVLDGADFIFAS